MKRIGYINGQRVKGAITNVSRIKAIKRGITGAVSLTPAPNTKATSTGIGAAAATTKSFTLGLTGVAGGRNFVKGKFIAINTNATKKVTLTAKVKTLAGTQNIKTGVTGTKTASKTTSNTASLPIGIPGTLVVVAAPTAGKIGTIKLATLSVNALTTMLM